jgi:hypothetical protein
MMPVWGKFLLGLAVALAAGWVSHGPLGHGAAFVDSLQVQGDAMLARTEVPGITVRFERDPLSRRAILSGPADDFQREGQGQFPGINDRIAAIPGVAGFRWENEP